MEKAGKGRQGGQERRAKGLKRKHWDKSAKGKEAGKKKTAETGGKAKKS